MKTWSRSFNTYLLFLALAFLTGCGTGSGLGKKEASTLRLHLETRQDPTGHTMDVPIYRANPTIVTVDKDAILNEGNVTKAELIDANGTFAIRITFNRHGKLVLETASLGNRGKKLAIFSLFGEARWIGVVTLNQRIADGTLVFTPDATRKEAERFVRGLTNVAAHENKNPDF